MYLIFSVLSRSDWKFKINFTAMLHELDNEKKEVYINIYKRPKQPIRPKHVYKCVNKTKTKIEVCFPYVPHGILIFYTEVVTMASCMTQALN